MLFNRYDPQFKQPDGSYLLAQTARTALVQVGVASDTLQDPQQAPAAAGGSTFSIYSADRRTRVQAPPPAAPWKAPQLWVEPPQQLLSAAAATFNSPDKWQPYAQPLNRQLKLVGLGSLNGPNSNQQVLSRGRSDARAHDPTAVADDVRWQQSHASPTVRDVLRRLPPPTRLTGTLGALISDMHAELKRAGHRRWHGLDWSVIDPLRAVKRSLCSPGGPGKVSIVAAILLQR